MSLQDELNKLDAEREEKTKMLDQIQRELKDLEYRRVLLEADLRGLEERRRTLESFLGRGQPVQEQDRPRHNGSGVSPQQLTLQAAVLMVVEESQKALSIEDVLRRLGELGRHDRRDSVSVTLANLAASGRIARLARGVFGSR